MSWVDIFRTDPGSGQAHHGINRDVDGTTRRSLAHFHITEALDFGGGATGSVFNAATTDALGTFIGCDGKNTALFKLEFDALGTRQFRAVYKDKNGTTVLYAPGRDIYQASSFGVADGVGAAVTRVSGYFHADMLVVPCYGAKEITLWLLDGLSVPTVHAWAVAI